MKTLTIVTKSKARKLQLDSLFTPVDGQTLTSERYDGGCYKVASFIGREVQVPDHVHALWMEPRKDADGPYLAMFCMRTARLSAQPEIADSTEFESNGNSFGDA